MASQTFYPGVRGPSSHKEDDPPHTAAIAQPTVDPAVPKAVLYSWKTSVWATVVLLCLYEKGYSEDEFVVREVDITKGENFSPAYLKINASGTVPTLVVPSLETTGSEVSTRYRSLRDTTSIAKFLDQARSVNTHSTTSNLPAPSLSPATIEGKVLSDELIATVHSPTVDPNFLYLSARTRAELEKKTQNSIGTFVKDRQSALKQYLREATATAEEKASKAAGADGFEQRTAQFLKDKLSANLLLESIYIGKAGQETESGFFDVGIKAWSKYLPECLDNLEKTIVGTFALGDHVALADLHIISWLTRIVEVCGTDQKDASSMEIVGQQIGNGYKVGPKVAAFWAAWVERESFKTVYKKNLTKPMP